MKTMLHLTLVCVALTFTATAAERDTGRLTPRRIAELTSRSDAPKANAFRVQITGLHCGRQKPCRAMTTTMPFQKPQAVLECIREFRFPTAFDLPQAAPRGSNDSIVPMTPTSFETVNTGWTIRLSARREGKLIALYGVAEYVEFEGFLRGGYGPIAQPIYSESGDLITPNKIDQPKFQTTTTRFHLFAVPGEPYEVKLHRGKTAEKTVVTVGWSD
jgi:hypothetical protein